MLAAKNLLNGNMLHSKLDDRIVITGDAGASNRWTGCLRIDGAISSAGSLH